MTTEERLDKLAATVETLASTVVSHDSQIEALITVAEGHSERMKDIDQRIDALVTIAENHAASIRELVDGTIELRRQWEAYLNRQPRQ